MRKILENYGVDYDRTMERFIGSEEIYLDCLKMLMDDESLAALKAAVAANDLQAAFSAAHTLKGVAGNMGLTPLSEASGELTELLRAQKEADYPGLTAALEAEFERVKQMYRQLTDISEE